MKANRHARRQDCLQQGPDGAAMLLLAGFIVAGAAVIAIGTFAVIERSEQKVTAAQSEGVVNLFLNTRTRAVEFFEVVSPHDTKSSFEAALDGYLSGQHRTARSLGLDLNVSLAGNASDAPDALVEWKRCQIPGNPATPKNCNSESYFYEVSSYDDEESYTCVNFDGTNDGLIEADGEIKAALIWIRVLSPDAELEEVLIVDVPSTSAGC